MAALCWAKLLVAAVPFSWWRTGLGGRHASPIGTAEARDISAQVESAARRLPIETKCLTRAMALSWVLRRRQNAHTVVIAIRPSQLRQSPDALHAWVEVGGARVIGDLPGPWVEVLRLGG
jgi:aryl-alcohol dehydrogenase-like predicted oxidoreductase